MEITYLPHSQEVLDRLAGGAFDEVEWFRLKSEAEYLSLIDGFDRLLSLDLLDLRLYDHQRSAVLRVLREMRGRAVLADEVGLGKTIEAGVIVKEYMLRSLVRRVLVLVPASLVAQWRSELREKFRLDFRILDSRLARSPTEFQEANLLLASIDRAKRSPCSERIVEAKWDMVVVDEAHRLKNSASANWRFVNALRKKYLLLLTATPVQNDLRELYNLVTLLKPGQLKTFSRFKEAYMLDKRSPKNTRSLRKMLSEVMVRTARRESLIRFPKRIVESIAVPMGELERRFYEGLLTVLREAFRRMPKDERNLLPLVLVLREACSHPKAAKKSLEGMLRRGSITVSDPEAVIELGRGAESIVPSKLEALVAAVKKAASKCIVFTEFRTTQRELAGCLTSAGFRPIAFHGGLTATEKEEAIREFRERGDVLVSTQAGSEGRNLQFCSVVVNYDLPWNPMRIEQRIGRVHRLGQERSVNVVNLATEGTVESYVLYLLEKKIGMFNKVIGEMDDILADLEASFEERLARAFLGSDDEMRERLRAFERELERAVARYERARSINAALFEAGGSGDREEEGAGWRRG